MAGMVVVLDVVAVFVDQNFGPQRHPQESSAKSSLFALCVTIRGQSIENSTCSVNTQTHQLAQLG